MEDAALVCMQKNIRYDPDSGLFFWRKSGKQMFRARKRNGYLHATIGPMRKTVLAHRAAIALSTGSWPDGVVNHKNRDTSDNRISNLETVSQAQNIRHGIATRGARPRYIYRSKSNTWVAKRSAELGGKTTRFKTFCEAWHYTKASRNYWVPAQ